MKRLFAAFLATILVTAQAHALTPDPGQDRFVQFGDPGANAVAEGIDKIPRRGGHSSDWNTYSYARNNPQKYTDPTGNFPWLAFLAGVVAGVFTSTPTDTSLSTTDEILPVILNTSGGVSLGAALSGGGACQAASIEFGHGARHLAGTGLSAAEVESAIAADIAPQLQNASSVGSFWGRTAVNGTAIEYRGFGLGSGAVRIGTYYIPR